MFRLLPDPSRLPSRLTIFALLYAWANVLHQLSFPEWIRGLHVIGWLLFLASAALALKPSSLPLFAATLGLRVVYTLDWMPMIREHLFLEGLLSTGILMALGLCVRDWKDGAAADLNRQEQLFERFAPFLRVTTLLVYGATAVCKFNSAFLAPQTSEAVKLLYWTASKHSWLPTSPGAQHLSIWATLLFEAGIPLLLLGRRTRWLGIGAGLFFHTLLGFLPLKIASFTLVMYLLLFSWFPRQSAAALHAGFLRLGRRLHLKPLTFAFLCYGIAGSTGMVYAARRGFNLDMRSVDLGLGVWWWQTLAAVVAVGCVRGLPQLPASELLRVRSNALRCYLLFILFNCLCPYIGLKDRLVFTMHSNLLTAKGYWNHLFLPEALRVFRYQDELVTITDSNLPDFAAVRTAGMPMPYFEFKRWCRRINVDFFVEYRNPQGTLQRFEKLRGQGSDPALMRPQPLLEKFLCFNPVGASYDYVPELIPHIGPARNSIPKFEIKTGR